MVFRRVLSLFFAIIALAFLFNQAVYLPAAGFQLRVDRWCSDGKLMDIENSVKDAEKLLITVRGGQQDEVVCRYENSSRIKDMLVRGSLFVPNCEIDSNSKIDISDESGRSVILYSELSEGAIGVLVEQNLMAADPATCDTQEFTKTVAATFVEGK